jgi:hypothetical protein
MMLRQFGLDPTSLELQLATQHRTVGTWVYSHLGHQHQPRPSVAWALHRVRKETVRRRDQGHRSARSSGRPRTPEVEASAASLPFARLSDVRWGSLRWPTTPPPPRAGTIDHHQNRLSKEMRDARHSSHRPADARGRPRGVRRRHGALGSRDGQPLPDPHCTPGASNPQVTQANINDTICATGWTKTVRPPVAVTDRMMAESARSYGLGRDQSGEYDHLVSLEFGGAPRRSPQPVGGTGKVPQLRGRGGKQAQHGGVLRTGPPATARAAVARDWVIAFNTAGLRIAGARSACATTPAAAPQDATAPEATPTGWGSPVLEP